MKKARTTHRPGKPFSRLAMASEGYQQLVTVAAFPQPIEAHLLRSYLEAEGIPCVLGNEYIAIVDSPISTITGGVQVRVRVADVPQAQVIIHRLNTP